ncbi:MAG: transcriptional repressor [Nanoarchaeota archaeon]
MSRLRTTKQLEILRKSMEKNDAFFDAESLYEEAKKKDADIGIATIYRFLREEADAGNLFSYRCGKRRVYSRKKKSHCHFVCEETGKVIHFDVDSIDFLKDKIPGEITSFQIEVRGIRNDHKKQKKQ